MYFVFNASSIVVVVVVVVVINDMLFILKYTSIVCEEENGIEIDSYRQGWE